MPRQSVNQYLFILGTKSKILNFTIKEIMRYKCIMPKEF